MCRESRSHAIDVIEVPAPARPPRPWANSKPVHLAVALVFGKSKLKHCAAGYIVRTNDAPPPSGQLDACSRVPRHRCAAAGAAGAGAGVEADLDSRSANRLPDLEPRPTGERD